MNNMSYNYEEAQATIKAKNGGELPSVTKRPVLANKVNKRLSVENHSYDYYYFQISKGALPAAALDAEFLFLEIFVSLFLLRNGLPPQRTRSAFILGNGSAGGRIIQERRCCAGMQQRRLPCGRWHNRVQCCHCCKADSE